VSQEAVASNRPRANDLAEFKEIRAAWRKRKKEEAKEVAEHHAVVHGAVHHPLDIERMEKDAYEAQGKWLAH
jgi:crotonobetainyl-CoA:carnitine CoA-transferase CaiB-like acyl-CoA transferase